MLHQFSIICPAREVDKDMQKTCKRRRRESTRRPLRCRPRTARERLDPREYRIDTERRPSRRCPPPGRSPPRQSSRPCTEFFSKILRVPYKTCQGVPCFLTTYVTFIIGFPNVPVREPGPGLAILPHKCALLGPVRKTDPVVLVGRQEAGEKVL